MAALASVVNEGQVAGRKLKQSIYHTLSRVLWGAIVILIVLLAVYVSVGRMLSSLTGSFQAEILQGLNQRVPFTIDADRVSSQWHSFTPVLVLEGLRLTMPGESGRTMELAEGRIALDVAGSLLAGSLQMTLLNLSGLQLAGELDTDGRLHIRGFDAGDSPLGDSLEGFLLTLEQLALDDVHLELLLPGGEERRFDLNLALSREGSRRHLEGQLLSSRGMEIFFLGEGIGNPFAPEAFTGRLYLDVATAELGAVNDLLPDSLRGLRVDGGLGLELWSNWDLGKSSTSLRIRMDAAQLSARDGSWKVSLDRVGFAASLADQNGGWGLSIADLELARGGAHLQVPRLQLNIRGETLNLGAQGLALAPLSTLLADTESLPAAAAELLRTLSPRGTLSSLQASISDTGELQSGWQLQARFDELAVDAWHGAPGITGARGYVELSPGSGFVVLDSSQFDMDFPTVYEKPLHYDSFRGTIYIDWDEEAVKLSSGLVQALGDEGTVPVLFGLNIPLLPTDTGLEMDLLVGLQSTAPRQRGKYIPFILDEGLRSWLAGSIGDGLIEQGAFLWRGSLTAGASELRTVQLFFNIQDTALSYHPDWPPLSNVDGTVLINDSKVSVWAATANLLESDVKDLSVEVWSDHAAQLWLALDGRLAGPAADGLAVVNDSPLQPLVGEAFSDWQLSGQIDTDLQLQLNLTDASLAPRVGVSVKFNEVDLDILPGRLPLRGISGVLDYDTATGFSSRELAGQLWGRPLQAVVSQRPAQAETGRTAVSVALSTSVDVDDVQRWLAPDMPHFARGETAVTAHIVTGAGEPPTMSIDSKLLGVALELPQPFDKPAGVAEPLHLDLSLGGESLGVSVALDSGFTAQLDVRGGHLHSAALSLGGERPAPEPGVVRIGGRVAHADSFEWEQFLMADAPADQEVVAAVEQVSVEPAGSPPPLAIDIEKLRVDRLLAEGQDLGPVLFSLADEGGQWRLDVETDWLQGELLYVSDGESRLDLRYLDLAGPAISESYPGSSREARIIKVPDMAVTIADLRQADASLGELAFDLRSEGDDLQALNITGNIASMELQAAEPGRLVWRQGPDSQTSVEARLVFKDLGNTLQALGYQKIIETDSGTFDLALEWAGGPRDFSLQHGQGSLRVAIGKGHFSEVSGGAAGALRVVSILNLAEIVQRLSLTHMFEEGIPFDDVDGEVLLQGGRIEVPRMDVQGGASSFQFSGVSVVESRALDGELVVTLPVANNLPWVAALAAGLPVAAGVFVLSKVFETPLNRLTSAVYTATGTWDDPTVEFDRVFDDTPGEVAQPEVPPASRGSQPPPQSESP